MDPGRIGKETRAGFRKQRLFKLCLLGAIGVTGCGTVGPVGAVGASPQNAAGIANAMKEPFYKQALAAAASGQHIYSTLLAGPTDVTLPARLDALALSARLAGWRLKEVVPLQREGSTRDVMVVFELESRR